MLTRNEDTGELSCWPAVSPYSSPNRALIDVELVDENGHAEVLETTFDHPFYVLGEGWVRVEHLEVGDIVPTTDGQATVVGLAWKGQLATVYNFGVEQTRSYFVGETGAWVHNCIDDLIDGGKLVSGRFPKTANGDDVLYRVDPQTGKVSHYQVYDADGLPLKRVDLEGRAHGGVETPHVVDFERHTNPKTGEVFPRPSKTVRPALPDEIPKKH